MSLTVRQDERAKFAQRARDAILCETFDTAFGRRPETIFDRSEQREVAWKPERAPGIARPLAIVRHCLEFCGVPRATVDTLSKGQLAAIACGADPTSHGVRMSASEAHYNVTGMFQNILLDAQNVLLRQSYGGNTTFQTWAKRGEPLSDFKEANAVIAGDLGDPKAVGEGGEFEESTITDGKEKFKLTVWGFAFSTTWQVLANDKLSSFTEVPIKMIRAQARKQNRLVYSVLKDNLKLADGVELFHASAVGSGGHNNKTTGAVTDYAAAFATMMAKMSQQKGLSPDSAALNIPPAYVLFPPAIADKIGTLLRSTYIPGGTNNTENIYAGSVIPVQDAELGLAFGGSDTAFYHVASGLDVDTVSYHYLEGYEAPRIEMKPSFGTLGLRQRCYHPFAVKALDFRGVQQHTGA